MSKNINYSKHKHKDAQNIKQRRNHYQNKIIIVYKISTLPKNYLAQNLIHHSQTLY